MKLTVEHFTVIDPNLGRISKYLPFLNMYLEKYSINTWQRLGAFLAQIIWESDQLKTVVEYASGAAYEGRKDLGNTISGDGVRFKGRGLIQLTGRNNYFKFTHWNNEKGINFVTNPELLEIPRYAVLASVFYWSDRKLNQYADNLKFDEITRIINGGNTHAAERKQTWLKTLEICKQIIQS